MTTAYSFTTPRLGPPPARVRGPLCVFAVFHNGVPFVHPELGAVEHGSIDAACKRIFRLAAEFNTALECFRVERQWL